MTETTNKKSTQLAEYLTSGPVTIGVKRTPGIQLTYKWVNSNDPEKVRTVQYIKGSLGESSIKTLCSLKPHNGDRFVMVKEEKPNPQNPTQPFWNVVEIKDKSTWEDKPVSTYNRSGGKTYDDTGVKVGAARNQALAFLAATKGANFTLDDVDKTAEEIVGRQAAQEAKLRAAKATTTAEAETAAAANHNDAYQREDTGASADQVPF